ncbi:hypothetical protein NDU88_001726 [Pleurodeles waltl]|uniref:Uncharacterized protein n=1 Tax=Pleurodeles waltl TaxID=8319 RepID=A0AAV7LCA5_PLEWA|nr:hypothetical protein NDU88_001726 [Pleurodeles waltl]
MISWKQHIEPASLGEETYDRPDGRVRCLVALCPVGGYLHIGWAREPLIKPVACCFTLRPAGVACGTGVLLLEPEVPR